MEWFEQLRTIWTRLPGQQRAFMVAVAIALVVVIVLVTSWAGRQEFSVLYAELEAGAAAEIVDKLTSRGIAYKLRDAGGTILVPKSEVYQARLDLASSGLPQVSGHGYEILDTNKMGWTDFVQKIQFRRALEGEISRTIQTLDEVAQARVHLVIPEPSLFQEDEKPTTASVVVKLRGGATLRDSHVQGIVHLVAAGVEGLQAGQVTVLDTRGRLLSRPADEDGLLGTTADQIYLTRTVEEGLLRKAQSALERVLGPNKAVVRVSVELDFERVETTREIFDSENPVIRSEQRTEESSTQTGTSEQSVTNYEVSKTVQRIVDTPGTVERISASVFVDGTYEENEDGERLYIARAPEEMAKLTNLIKAAIGFDADRGDRLSIENVAFDDTEMIRTLKEMERTHLIDMIQKIGGVVVSLLLAGGTLIILWRLIKRARAAVPETGRPAGLDGEEEEDEQAGAAKDARGLRLEKKIQQISKHSPEDISRIVQAWLKEA